MKSRDEFKKDKNELQNIFSFLEDFWTANSLGEKTKSEIELTVEELFMNMVRHNPDQNSPIQLFVERHTDKIEVVILDKETIPFDITKTKEVDLDDYIKKEKSGGLGIHLVKELMDDISFKHEYGISTITLTKYICE